MLDMEKPDIAQNGIEKAFVQSMLMEHPDIVFVKNTELVYISASQSFADMLGLGHPDEIVGKTDAQLFGDIELARRYNDDDRHLMQSGKPLRDYVEPSISGGKRVFFRTSKFPLFDDKGVVIGLYAISCNITREYTAKLNYEQELRSLFQLSPNVIFAALFDISHWLMMDVKLTGDILSTSGRYSSIDEYIAVAAGSVEDDESVRNFYRNFSPEVLDQMYESGKRRTTLEYRRRAPDGQVRWVRAELYFLLDPLNENLCVATILTDIDDEKRAEQDRAHAAEWDALTNVLNRQATMTHIRNFLSDESPTGTHWLFMIDVDNFKQVNDTFGHLTGDDTLNKIAASIQKVFGEEDIVGRVGGDEFFALMKNTPDRKAAIARAQELVEALQYVCSEENNKVELSGSVGIGCYAGDGKPLERLYMEADAALYRAKQAGKNCYAFASDEEAKVVSNQESGNTVHLRTLLGNIDAAMFQTELTETGDIRVTYSSHSLLLPHNKEDSDRPSIESGKIWDVILPEDVEGLKKAMRTAAQNGDACEHICRVCNTEGRIEWRHIRGTHLPDAGDGIRRMIYVATDITKQKKIEAELREKDSVIDFAMRNTDINLWYVDYETAVCYLTKSCQQAHGMPGTETLSNFPQKLFDLGCVRKDCEDALRDTYEKVRTTGESVTLDVWYRKVDGKGWWCERDMISPLVGADGRVTQCIGIGKDVTSEKKMEEKFHAFQSYRSMMAKSTLMSVRLNLTTGWCGDFVSNHFSTQQVEQANTVDGFFDMERACIPTVEEAEALVGLSRTNLLEEFSRGETSLRYEYRSDSSGEHPIWLRGVVDMMKNPSTGDIEGLFYTFDIDYEKSMNLMVEKLLLADYEFLGLVDVATGRLMVFGDHANNLDSARNGYGYSVEMQRVFQGLIQDEYYQEGIRTMACEHVMRELEQKEFYTCSFPARAFAHTKAGRKQWKFSYLDSSRSKLLMTRSDITNIYTAERDPLTGLYNRETFYRRTREVLDAHLNEKFLLIRFDIDRFKAYNDACGVQAGDRILAQLGRAARKRAWPQPSVFGRLEADHFVSLMPVQGFDVPEWHTRLIQFFEAVEPGYRFSISTGIYAVVDQSMDVSLMCDRALLALRTIKDSYTKKLAWYNENLRSKLLREQSMQDEMENALRGGQFLVYLQPLINYDLRTVIGAEALVRWAHPKHGLLSPDEFIPLFEKNGFIFKLDAYVWEKSCGYLRGWMDRKNKLKPVPISVNISRRDLYSSELCERLYAMVNQYRLPPSMLKLEITETAYMEDPGQLIEVVKKLRFMGFIVEMDDFGSGYSSLNMLKDVPVDVLKLDTRFLSESANNERANTILASIIRMAQELTLPVIAEGVETKAQADYLKNLDCFQMQGYYFGCPMPVSEFERLIALT